MGIKTDKAIQIFETLLSNAKINNIPFSVFEKTTNAINYFKKVNDTIVFTIDDDTEIDIRKMWTEGFYINNKEFPRQLVCSFGEMIGYPNGLMIIFDFANFNDEQWQILFSI